MCTKVNTNNKIINIIKSEFPLSRPWIEAVHVPNFITFQPLIAQLINVPWDEMGRRLSISAAADWKHSGWLRGKASYFEMSSKPPRGDFRLAVRYTWRLTVVLRYLDILEHAWILIHTGNDQISLVLCLEKRTSHCDLVSCGSYTLKNIPAEVSQLCWPFRPGDYILSHGEYQEKTAG